MVLVKRKRHASRLREAGAPETVSGQEERLLCFGMIGRMADKGAACVVSKEAVKRLVENVVEKRQVDWDRDTYAGSTL